MAPPLTSVDEVIDALGGLHAVAGMTRRSATAVHNWRALRRFPASLYLKMTRLLRRKRLHALPGLWGQEDDIARAA